MTKQEAGRLGGLATAAKMGRAYMSQIGARGFQAYADAHHNGDRAAARKALKLDGQPVGHLNTPPEWIAWADERGLRAVA